MRFQSTLCEKLRFERSYFLLAKIVVMESKDIVHFSSCFIKNIQKFC